VTVAVSYLADAIALSGVSVVAYVSAVSLATGEEWHLVIGRVDR
jgi:hypothetical protein